MNLAKTTRILVATPAFTLSCLLQGHAEETELIAYPTVEEASFVIEVPTTWEMTQADGEGDFFHLEGPTGAMFSFRTLSGSEDAMAEAVDDTLQPIGNLFAEIDLGEPKDWEPSGLSGFYATGSGKDKEGNAYRIGVAWVALNDGKIAQVWFVSDADDASGMSAAESIANSIQPPDR